MKSHAWQRQHDDYIVKQLSDFKARKRTNDAGSMTSVSNILNDKDIENLAHCRWRFECSCGGRLGETGLPERMHALLNQPPGNGSLV